MKLSHISPFPIVIIGLLLTVGVGIAGMTRISTQQQVEDEPSISPQLLYTLPSEDQFTASLKLSRSDDLYLLNLEAKEINIDSLDSDLTRIEQAINELIPELL